MPLTAWLRRGFGGGGKEGPSTFSAPPPTQHVSPSPSLNSNLKEADLKETEQDLDDDSSSAEHDIYIPIHNYEGRHRYDPKAEWTPEEEKRLVRKLDLKVCAWVCFMFFALQLDRGNIGAAVSDNMLDDIGITTNDYNYGQTIFYVSFLAAELPSGVIGKKLGPDNWLPIEMILWSICSAAQSKIKGRGSFFLFRALLGLCEGGWIPDVVLYLSYWYKSKELPVRLSYFWGAYCATFIISAFLAFGILHLRGHYNMAGWQWLFIIEGAFTSVVGIVSWFYLPPSPTQTASRFRGKNGWFSEREEVILVNRIIRDDPSKGDMHNRQAVGPKLLWRALTDYDMWPIFLLGITWGIPSNPASQYLTLTLKGLGFDTFTTNLLIIPAYVLFGTQLLFWTWYSERLNNRYIIVLACQIWMLPMLVALEKLPAGPQYAWSRWALNSLLVGYPYIHAILVALTSRNAGSVRTRTVGAALYNMTVQASNVIASNIYRDNDKPLYRKGNRILLGILAWNIVLIMGSKYYYMWRNARREAVWSKMSQLERNQYLTTTKDRGNKRLDFRFAH